MSKLNKKHTLTIDFIIIIGKYFKTNKDYINIMKVCKKYKEMILFYHFNPISDISLFENIQTQHFYNKEDIKFKKNGLFRYIYWYSISYNDYKYKNNNEIFKNVELNRNDLKIIDNKIIVPDCITKINEECFYELKNVYYIKLSKNLKFIDDYVFIGSDLIEINIPYGCKYIGNYCFDRCYKLKTLNIPDSVKFIGINNLNINLIKNSNISNNIKKELISNNLNFYNTFKNMYY